MGCSVFEVDGILSLTVQMTGLADGWATSLKKYGERKLNKVHLSIQYETFACSELTPERNHAY